MELCGANNVQKISGNEINFISMAINEMSIRIKEKVYEYIDEEEASILQGIILGDTRKNR